MMVMEFEDNQQKSYTVQGFYQHFKSCLPKLAKVSQGFRGSSEDETLYEGEIIVVVSKTCGGKSTSKHGSGECLEIFRVEDGDGKLGEKPVYVPVNFHELNVSEVTGIRGQSKAHWTAYQENIRRQFAGPHQAVGGTCDDYEGMIIRNPKSKPVPGTKRLGSAFLMLKQKLFNNEKPNTGRSKITQNEPIYSPNEEENKYAISPFMVKTNSKEEVNSATKGLGSANRNKRPPVAPKPALAKPNTSIIEDLRKELTERQTGNLPKAKEPVYENNFNYSLVRPFEETLVKIPKQKNATEMHTFCDDSDRNEWNISDLNQDPYLPYVNQPGRPGHYVNSTKAPDHRLYSAVNGKGDYNPSYVQVYAKTEFKGQKKNILTPEEVAALSVEDIGEYLKLLNLHKIVETFESQQVDGVLLASLDEDILVSDYNLNRAEAKKLLNFAREGRLPLSRKTII